MKLLIDIADNKVAGFMELVKDQYHITAKPLSVPDADLLDEIRKIKKAFKQVTKIRTGKLKGRPVAELLEVL